MSTHAMGAPQKSPGSGDASERSDQKKWYCQDSAFMGGVTVVGTVLVAIGIVVGLLDEPTEDNPSGSPTGATSRGISYEVEADKARSEFVFTGTASPDIAEVAFKVGSKYVPGQTWYGDSKVVGSAFRVVVPTPQPALDGYRVTPFMSDSVVLKAVTYELGMLPLVQEPPPPPSPPPDRACAEQYGEACYNGPGWEQGPTVESAQSG